MLTGNPINACFGTDIETPVTVGDEIPEAIPW
jgi:hypothetical protein